LQEEALKKKESYSRNSSNTEGLQELYHTEVFGDLLKEEEGKPPLGKYFPLPRGRG
jgi:hypothetical protein